MTFPDGTIKEGSFQNNTYIGPTAVSNQASQQQISVEGDSKPSTAMKAPKQPLQPLLIKKTVNPEVVQRQSIGQHSSNENKNQTNSVPQSGYNSSTSGGGGPLISGKHQPLRPIKEETTTSRTPNIFSGPPGTTQTSRPPRATSRPSLPATNQQSAQKPGKNSNPLTSSFEGITVLAGGKMRDISTDARAKAPAALNPVQPPVKRQQDINSSVEIMPFAVANDYLIMNGGYSSPGQESDSTRISNLKYHSKAAGLIKILPNASARDSQASTALSKITKMQPGGTSVTLSPGHGAANPMNQTQHAGGFQSVHHSAVHNTLSATRGNGFGGSPPQINT